MRVRDYEIADSFEPRRVLLAQLGRQMRQFVPDLSVCYSRSGTIGLRMRDLSWFKPVSPLAGLIADGMEVCTDGGQGTWPRAEAVHLRVVTVDAGFRAEESLGQQRLTPESNESHGFEALGVERPEAHCWVLEGWT